ncbi:MAG: hypothetical protein ACTHOH_14035 [Lysobacteraceae bacterium]
MPAALPDQLPDAPPVAPPRPARDWSGRFLALLGLCVSLASLGYTTWRNETTEAHRNARQAAFLLLDQAAQWQQIVDTRVYGGDESQALRIAAWGKAGLVRDLGPLVSTDAGRRADAAFAVWSRRAEALDRHDEAAAEALSTALRDLRMQVIADLHRLR